MKVELPTIGEYLMKKRAKTDNCFFAAHGIGVGLFRVVGGDPKLVALDDMAEEVQVLFEQRVASCQKCYRVLVSGKIVGADMPTIK